MSTNAVQKMMYNVISGEIREYKANTKRAGQKYAFLTLVPKLRVRGNIDEKHNIVSDVAYDVEQLPLFLAAKAEGKPVAQYAGIFEDIPCHLALVTDLPPFRMGIPDKPGEFGKNVRTAMSVLMFLSPVGELMEDPKDAARRIIERAGKWETSTPATAVATPMSVEADNAVTLPDGWSLHPTLEGIYTNAAGEMKTAAQLGIA